MTRRSLRRVPNPTPRSRGARWPAEWARHEATWMAWPHDASTWPGCLEQTEAAFAQLAVAVAGGEDVVLLVPDTERRRRAQACVEQAGGASRVQYAIVRTADAWLRDTGPIVVKAKSERIALDFRFTAWGGKYDELLADDRLARTIAKRHAIERVRVNVALEGGAIDGNGRGTLLTTEQCLLHENRNPDLNRAEIEWNLREALGVRQVLWLGEGIAGDDTDGHVDDIARFVAPNVIVAAVERDPADENHAPLQDNLRRLRAMVDSQGRGFDVVPLPMPRPVTSQTGGHRLPASYANFYVANRTVCVPVFGDKRDAAALRVLRKCFPHRTVTPIRCEHVVEGFGALHCVTQQLPK